MMKLRIKEITSLSCDDMLAILVFVEHCLMQQKIPPCFYRKHFFTFHQIRMAINHLIKNQAFVIITQKKKQQ